MKRTKLDDRQLPTYTKGEEIFNMVSHIVGGALGIISLIACIVVAIKHNNPCGVVSGIIFSISIIVMYVFSSIYHGLRESKAKKVFQVLDHCVIFVLIAGSYTPFALCTFRAYDPTFGWTLFGIIWGLAILGIVLNAIDLRRFRVFSMICYLVMGWCIIFRIDLLIQLIGNTGFALLLSGGIVYTLGTIFYGLGRNHKYMHSIFHLFIVAANILQFLCILLFVM